MSNSSNEYFDLHVNGLGYLYRARLVHPKAGQRFSPFLAVDINAIHGPRNSVTFVYFDCRVSGEEAGKVIQDLASKINSKDHKVLAGFKIGDMFLGEPYERNGETRVPIKGRLLRLGWVKVDGKVVYTAPQPTEADTEGKTDQPATDNNQATQAESNKPVNVAPTSNDATDTKRVNGQEYAHAPGASEQNGMPQSGYSVSFPTSF
jgi:hypothetical protein